MLHPAEQDHIEVGRTLGCRIELLDGGVCVLHPHQQMRSFNSLSCWSAAALPRLTEQAISFYRSHGRDPVIALTDLLPTSAHAQLIDAGWQPLAPLQLFMQRSGAPPAPHSSLDADITIDQLTPELIEPFVALVARSFDWDAALQAQQVALYRRQVAERIGRHYVALADGALVATTSILPSAAPPTPSWGLYKVTTQPGYRGRGIATALLMRALQDAAAEGLERVFLYTRPDGPAVALYERLGFSTLFCRTLYRLR